ncbi:MAG: hypothetical protein H0U70_09610 [Tatlockia sp.]|nr:hypothetical protein [Tatlockia sp.]
MTTPVILTTYIQGNHQILIDRTLQILELLTQNNSVTAAWFNDELIKNLKLITALKPHSRFHELYLKCLFYSQLVKVINLEQFKIFSLSDKVLVELLFSPALETNLIGFYKMKNFKGLITNYNLLTNSINSVNFKNEIDCWENTNYLSNINQHLQEYINWFNVKKDPVEEKPAASKAQVEKTSALFNQVFNRPEFNVEMEEIKELSLEKGGFLGTTGLYNCVAIISVVEKENEKPKVFLKHSVYDHEPYMEWVYNNCQKKGQDVSFYLIGGMPDQLENLLPIIYKGKLSIKDLCLVHATVVVNACVIHYEDCISIDVLTYPSAETLFNDRSHDNSSSENDSSEDSRESHEPEPKETPKSEIISDKRGLSFFTNKRERPDSEQAEKGEQEIKKIKNDFAL